MPCRRERLPTPVFWPGEFHGLYSPCGLKELDTTEQLSLSGGASGKEPTYQGRRRRAMGSRGQRNLVGYNPWGHKESDVTEKT